MRKCWSSCKAAKITLDKVLVLAYNDYERCGSRPTLGFC
jgi:hypothetical protein